MSRYTLPPLLESFIQDRGEHLRVFKSGPASQAVAADALLRAGRNVALIAPGAAEFREIAALLRLLSGMDDGLPVWDRPWVELGTQRPGLPDAAAWSGRMAALHGLVHGAKPKGLLLTADNLVPFWPSVETVRSSFLTLTQGDELSPEMLLDQAVEWGYKRRKVVAEPGEVAMRGDIFDICAPGYAQPLRLEFFGDNLEQIRLFDLASQRSRQELKEITLLPVTPAPLSGDRPERARARWDELRRTGEISADTELHLGMQLESAEPWILPGVYDREAAPLEAFFPPDMVCVLSSAENLRQRVEDAAEAWRDFVDRQKREEGRRWPLDALCRGTDAARNAWIGRRQLVFEDLTLGVEKSGLDLVETRYSEFSDLFWRPDQAQRPWAALVAALREWNRQDGQTLLCFRTERSRGKFLSLLEGENLTIATEYAPDRRGLFALVSPLSKGFELAWLGMRVLGEDVLQPRSETRTREPGKKFQGLDRYDDLLEGDLLVHRDYGLARFGGLLHMRTGDVENDYLLLHFDADDKLYLPVDRIKLVQRFKGPEGGVHALDRLGGSRWSKTTARVRKVLEKIAQDLVEMYAIRRVTKGYDYGELGEMYHEFESGFGFDATPDQDKAVREVFADMERPEPMDRLVCGDVGFGKTEVALRAAFRTVLEGRQVALLCPTTVLAEQHYQTFISRMEPFGVHVGLLSRFVPPKRQKTVVAAAARGEVDVLIGTHRMLSKDVELPNLGLMILDEEQRFGVKHKERLKHYRKHIDVLTLTATPIPRTLQLSLSGLRGLSVIETPPQDRKPVETALVERDEAMLAAALKREMDRGGQVFWVHNRVQGLEQVVDFVQKLAPEAKIGMAHGQMPERTLEETMHRFWHKELDVLVATAIIESGLDFPNVNTLIVDQAQMFGLGQLYQLRGRVGRSERQAYAYFVVSSLESLPETSRRRLRIILDMDYLGAGFKVAMEDLRLRGAGNILGEVQSGNIAKVGLDLFLEMLEEEVRKVRGEALPARTEPELSFVFRAHIPGEYVPDSKERLGYYRALSSASGEMARKEIEAELRDRFGPLPPELVNFLAVLSLKEVLARLQVERAELYAGRAVLTWGGTVSAVSPERLIDWVADRTGTARLLPPGRLELRWPDTLDTARGLEYLGNELESLAAESPGAEA
ncbi:transcription-repair coupling factor [Paucidesulfovibrio longus]|uniref:transcription-repair coupling factor n=1 Tax=Paucidesulfovibrio longus TaxID=889 RepID=UPI0003B664A1|nr:transcription-repair coupling factor [Paucidesulfovibrio longus]